MQSTITREQQAKIRDYFAHRVIPAGRGSEESACSIAGINLALTGRLTDEIPECMSEVIGRWIISVQDAMPADMRNSTAWKKLLPLAAGTGRAMEKERLARIMAWMWGTVLPSIQQQADAKGYGSAWRDMCKERTSQAAAYASETYAARAANAAHAAACCVNAKTTATLYAASAASYAALVASNVAATTARSTGDEADAWARLNPPALLKRLIRVS